MKIGVIGDDFTGSSDAANTLARAGARTLQYSGVPDGSAEPRDRRGGDRAQDAVGAGGGRGGAVAGRLPLARGRGRRTGGVQVLLHLRLDARGKHRAGGRGAPRRARRRGGAGLPGIPRDRADDLPGASLRARPAPERVRHGEASADADDRPGPAPVARVPDAARGRASAARGGARRPGGGARGHRRAAGGGGRDRGCRPPQARARREGAPAGDRGVRHPARAAGQLRHRAGGDRVLRGAARAGAGAGRKLLGGDAAAGGGICPRAPGAAADGGGRAGARGRGWRARSPSSRRTAARRRW